MATSTASRPVQASADELSVLPGAIEVTNVSKAFRLPFDRPSTLKQRILHPVRSRAARELRALDEVGFRIESGEFFGIVGRNGSGKSTLLKCMAGIYRPDSGTISVGGRLSPFIELGVGFNPELTARDNVVVNAALLGLGRSEALARFDRIIEFAELEEFVDLKLKNYSSGMQVRLGFAAAIQADADIYLVDEVLAVGDARFQEKCFETFRQMKRSGKTVVFVTHDMGTVERFCDRVMLLERGKRVALGEPRDVVTTYRQHDIEYNRDAAGPEPVSGVRRWGDGKALIEEAWFEDSAGERVDTIEQGNKLTVKARVRFIEAMENPIFGLVFRHESGVHVFAASSAFDHSKTGLFNANDEAIYSVSFDVVLGDAAYGLSLSVADQDGSRVADCREDFIAFRVSADFHTPGLVDLPYETKIDRVS